MERLKLETNTYALLKREPAFAAVRARQNVDAARYYLDRGVHNTGLYMVAGANYRIFDDLDHAAEMYQAALRYDKRPELYFNLGMVELDRGNRIVGKQTLIEAARFNPSLIGDIADPDIRDAAQRAIPR